MSENTLTPVNPILFFVSRILILAGMVLCFAVVFGAVSLVLCKFLFGVDAISNPAIFGHPDGNQDVINAMKFFQAFSSIGFFLIPALLFPRALRQWPGAFLRSSELPRLTFCAAAAGLILVSTPVISWLISLNEGIHFPASMADLEARLKAAEDLTKNLTDALVMADSFQVFVVNLLVVAVLPAIAEEFFFRGALMRLLQISIKSPHLTILLTAFAFSAFHGQFYGLIPRFILGMLLGYIAWYSNNIWPAVIAHFVNNAMALLARYLNWNESDTQWLREDYQFPWFIVLISMLSIFVILRWMMRNKKLVYDGE